MKKIFTIALMATLATGMYSCRQKQVGEQKFDWIADRFDDIKVLKYRVPGFDTLSLDEKKLVYYLSQAALSGRDILFDQNGRYNLRIRRTLEAIYRGYTGDRTSESFKRFEKYLKKVWFANGIHHHYSTDKFHPEFTEAYFDELIAATPAENFPADFGSVEEVVAEIKPVIFDPAVMPKRVNQAEGEDLIVTSANNYYEGVTQKEVERLLCRADESARYDARFVGTEQQTGQGARRTDRRAGMESGRHVLACDRENRLLARQGRRSGPRAAEADDSRADRLLP